MRLDPVAEARLLAAALQVLTRIPVPSVPWDDATLPRASRYFPLVGVLVGAVSGGAYLLARLLWTDGVAALLAVGAALLLTGALHEDGLADTADSLGGTTPARRLEIMKDSRIGTYGVCALALALALKVTALASLPAVMAVPALVAAAGGARLACVLAMALLPYAGERARSKLQHGSSRPGPTECVVAALVGLAPFLLLGPSRAGLALLVASALAFGLAWRLGRLLGGGYTGDSLGAVAIVFETGALLSVAGAGRLAGA